MNKRVRTKKSSTVDQYLARIPEPFRDALERLRGLIRKAAPGAEEALSWGMPVFKYKRLLAGYAGFKAHLSFFPMSMKAMRMARKELKDFKTTKGGIHFTPEKPLPETLVRKIIRARIREIEGNTAKRK